MIKQRKPRRKKVEYIKESLPYSNMYLYYENLQKTIYDKEEELKRLYFELINIKKILEIKP